MTKTLLERIISGTPQFEIDDGTDPPESPSMHNDPTVDQISSPSSLSEDIEDVGFDAPELGEIFKTFLPDSDNDEKEEGIQTNQDNRYSIEVIPRETGIIEDFDEGNLIARIMRETEEELLRGKVVAELEYASPDLEESQVNELVKAPIGDIHGDVTYGDTVLLEDLQGAGNEAEGSDGNRSTSIVPRESDILQGRGSLMHNNLANIRFRELVADHFEEYRTCSRKGKTKLSRTIVEEQKMAGARFLKLRYDAAKGESVWEELTSKKARAKVSYTFRNITKTRKRKRNRQNARRQRSML